MHSHPPIHSEHPAGSPRDSTARRILSEYPDVCRPERLVAWHSAGFSGAWVWRVESRGGPLGLRATPEALVDIDRLAGLHRLLRHVGTRGVSESPMPIARRDGLTWSIAEGHVWQLEPWMSGTVDDAIPPAPGRIASALSLLARWHAAAGTFVPTAQERAWFHSAQAAPSPAIGERRRRLEAWDAGRREQVRRAARQNDWPEFDARALRILELLESAAGGVARALELSSGVLVPLQPCLRDVWRGNVLFDDERATGLIDAHSCRSDSVAVDLARLLGSLAREDADLWSAGLAAYEQRRPLSVAERGLVEVLDRSGTLLSGLAWLQWRYLERCAFRSPEAALCRLDQLLPRLERLAQPSGLLVSPG